VLQGYAALHQVKGAHSKEEQSRWLNMAIGPLFRAASALGSQVSAHESASSVCMKAVLHWLLKDAAAAALEDLGPYVSAVLCQDFWAQDSSDHLPMLNLSSSAHTIQRQCLSREYAVLTPCSLAGPAHLCCGALYLDVKMYNGCDCKASSACRGSSWSTSRR
jgi:hypothetical protein